MKIVILGGGPAGLYCGLLIKKADPRHDVTIIERNLADVTYGWGVVFSDRTLASFQQADVKTYEQITSQFVIWDAIDVHYRGETIRCGGHVIASISRKRLLAVLQARCLELGMSLNFGCEVHTLADLPAYDLLIAADGINSLVRKTYEAVFRPHVKLGKARYIWLGANKVLDAFTFIFCENESGLFQVHAYPFSGTTSTFIVECDEASWVKAGLDRADEDRSLAFCEDLLATYLRGVKLLSNNSKWTNFPTLTTRAWQHENIVLLGDAAHTAHFSIGSGTKLAMEDAIALASALKHYSDLTTALNEYELERKPVVELFQQAALDSQTYFESLQRYLSLEPMQFTFQLLTRSGRTSYDDLRFRDGRFGAAVDRWFARNSAPHSNGGVQPVVSPAPLFAPLRLRGITLANRVVLSPRLNCPAHEGIPDRCHSFHLTGQALSGAGLILTEPVAVSAEGRITPGCAGLYTSDQLTAWTRIVQTIHTSSPARIALQLGHAGRRGSTQFRAAGLDRPLRQGNWPLLSASPLPYTPQSQLPIEMDRAAMDRVRDDFVRTAQMALEAAFDLLHLNFAHGYLLASFLSPLTNLRCDEYGVDSAGRMRYPLEIFDAVRSVWPQDRPLAVAISASDCVKGGAGVSDALAFVWFLKERGCAILEIRAGQTVMDGDLAYGPGFLTPLSDRVRNEASVPTITGGYLTTSNEVNTILAAGRADLCIMESS